LFLSIGAEAGNFWGVAKRYFARIFPKLSKTYLCDKLSPYKVSVAVDALLYIFFCYVALDLKIENWYLKFGT